ncbi:hypothetical protein [Lonepinella koalarum]|uniref:hypothetical protein n=1 Tax=Lonepinella koalarum TaxID=53417 RepID=UPI003F6E1706
MEQQDTQSFGKYIPHYLRDELMKAREKQAGNGLAKEQQTESTAEIAPETTEDNPINEPSQTAEKSPEKEPQFEPKTPAAPHSTGEDEKSVKDDNDVNAWKGRLKKEQAERQQLNARLIEEAEARERAEKRLRELEQKHTQPTTSTPNQPDPVGLSDKDLDEIKIVNPDLYFKLKAQLAQQQTQQQSSPVSPKTETETQPNTSVPKAPAQPTVSERERIWYAEIQREIPEVQGLLGDSAFMEFARSKTDWTGATGLDLIAKAGGEKDVRLIPAIRNLLDEYQQSQTKAPMPVTVAPQKNAPAKAKAIIPKEMTEKDQVQAEMLARQGKTAELRKFLAKFKQ